MVLISIEDILSIDINKYGSEIHVDFNHINGSTSRIILSREDFKFLKEQCELFNL